MTAVEIGRAGPLREPISVVIPLSVPVDQARTRIRTAVDSEERVDPPAAMTDRRLRGEIADETIVLWVQDSNLRRRRKSWNVEFRGELRLPGRWRRSRA
jgi:hypothetical protein